MSFFEEQLKIYRGAVEFALERALPPEKDSEQVLEAMRYSLLGGGKRIRGVLALSCCDILEGNYKNALPAAAAVEMIHSYSLIHDDLPSMDNDDLRRGKPSCHIRFGEATALLAGDGLLTLAFETLTEIEGQRTAISCIKELSRAAGYQGMIRGQELDLAAEGKALSGIEEVNNIHAHKTGALIAAAAKMGGIVGGATEEELEAIERYAKNIGLVFQIVDDLLDVSSNTEELGKPVGSDAAQNKYTYAVLYGREKSLSIADELTEEANATLYHCFGERSDFLLQFSKSLVKRNK